MASSKTTTDHKTIQHWIETHDGHPSRVKGTGGKDDDGGLLRVDFGEPEESLEKISWEEFFAVFDDRGLAFLHQEDKPHGSKSYFCKFVRREGDEK